MPTTNNMIGLDDQNGYIVVEIDVGDFPERIGFEMSPIEAAYLELAKQQLAQEMDKLLAVYHEGDTAMVFVSKINGEWVSADWDDYGVTYTTSDGITAMFPHSAHSEWLGVSGVLDVPQLIVQGF